MTRRKCRHPKWARLVDRSRETCSLCEAWREYTGEEFPATASYQMVIEGDIETRKSLERNLLLSNMSDVRRIFRLLRVVRQRRKYAAEGEDETPSKTGVTAGVQ